MNLYNLDSKITDKSYEILNNHIEEKRVQNNGEEGQKASGG